MKPIAHFPLAFAITVLISAGGRAPVVAADDQQPLLIINGHKTLNSPQIVRLEAMARKLGQACEVDETARQTLCMVLVEPDRGLFKRAVAMRALAYAGMTNQALRIVQTHDDLPLLELITSTLATHGNRAPEADVTTASNVAVDTSPRAQR